MTGSNNKCKDTPEDAKKRERRKRKKERNQPSLRTFFSTETIKVASLVSKLFHIKMFNNATR